LGDLGAEIIKVERPETGDDTRTWGPPYLKDAQGEPTRDAAYYLCTNRNKKSIAVDLSSTEGQQLVRALVLLCLLLLFALPLPWLYAKRDTLATHPRFAFMAPFTCKLFSCTPSASLDLGSIYSQQLLVRSHPRYQDALEVSFIFHNDATLPRPFPLVELAFSDLSNNLLANRLFKPEEYLPAELG
jgi:hypothetical protein